MSGGIQLECANHSVYKNLLVNVQYLWLYLCMYWIKRDVSDSGDDNKHEIGNNNNQYDDHDEAMKCLLIFITFSISSQRSKTLNLPHWEDDELFESFILELF